ncbi:alpha/beta-hydrolase [Cylindrobasidium torrendii FP15055 ss-10]|uniref:Alpha/beta-hydrolase n=1 Tax=Cylindrobasidium torrendii FP15055 ss-10 TaxID=1314674 RepID=A0A0D7BNK7_9AGAR|nr:alpha/beta-hydrolase [Cylindrobasidium torrendii FP15055 ss-10]
MPYVDLYSEDDYASIFYLTSSPFGNAGGFISSKPTVMLLHPFFLDSSWLDNQMGDPRLYTNYNLIAFDSRVSGQSTSRPTGRYDGWVDAADLALCHMRLRLPKCHIIAHDSNAVNAALRFACLFPDMCATLTLCTIPSQIEPKWVTGAYEEMVEQWCFSPDLESLELAGREAAKYMFGPEMEADLLDDLLWYWQMNLPPRRRTRILQGTNVSLNRQAMTPEMYKEIKMPVLLIHGDHNNLYPMKCAEEMKARLTSTDAVLYVLKGAAASLSTVQGNASICTQVFTKFLARQPVIPTEPLPITDAYTRMGDALQKLADFFDGKEATNIATRDPLAATSFCVLPPEIIQKQEEQLVLFSKDAPKAFDPLNKMGRPIRKFSERIEDHWFSGGKDGVSYASQFAPKQMAETLLSEASTEKKAESVVGPVVRSRRGTLGPSSVEKGVIKGSMAKVVSSNSSASASIGRLMKQ